MKKIQLLSAYGGPGSVMIEKGPYFVRDSYSPPVSSDGLNAKNGQEAVQTDMVMTMKKNIGSHAAEAIA